MRILLFDTSARSKLFPLTLTRAVADLRMGMFTIKERWEKLTSFPVSVLTSSYLQPLYGDLEKGEYLIINACMLPSAAIVDKLLDINLNEGVFDNSGLVACRLNFDKAPAFDEDISALIKDRITIDDVLRIEYPSDLYKYNARIIDEDFDIATKGQRSANNFETVQFTNSSDIFIEEGATLSYSILNATDGPIYIGKNTNIMEGCLIRGPFALCEGATLKMGTKIYGGTTIGPYCVAGGEIKNSILMGYTNKAHDGYLGDSVIGEWCNLGAGTGNSNMKNNCNDVKVWNYYDNSFINAGMKAGVIMGDYSRTSINTSINTGTVAGVCCNIFGDGLTPKHLPDFSWGNKESCKYEFDKAIRDISNWKKLKGKTLTSEEQNILKFLFDKQEYNHG